MCSWRILVLLEKYLGWLTGTGLLILFSVVIFPQSFQIVINWFGPVVGQNLTPILMIAFILLASGIKYPTVLVAYVVSGFACGAVGRGGIKRSLLLALAAYFTIILILGANIYPMLTMFSSFGSTSMPSPPPGTSLIDLLSLPLVSDMASTLIESMFSGGQGGMQGGMQAIYLSIVVIVLTSLAINLVTLCLTSVFGGLTTSKIIPRLRKGKTTPLGQNPNTKLLALSILSLTLFSQMPLVSCSTIKTVNNVSTRIFVTQDLGGLFGMGTGEFLLGQIQDGGGLSFIYANLGLDLATTGITLTADELQGVVFAGFAVRSGDVTGLPGELQQILLMLPNQGFFVLTSGEDTEAAEAQSQNIASEFEAALGIDFSEPSFFQIPMGEQQFFIVTYNTPSGMTVGDGYDAYNSLLPADGISPLLSPDSVVSKPFIALVGVINPEAMGGGGMGGTGGTIGFAVNFVEWNQSYFAGTSSFDFSLQQTLGYTGTISSNLPNGSYIAVTLPQTIDMSSLTVNINDAEIHENTIVLQVNPGDSYADLRIGFAARFPPNVAVTKSVSPSTTNAGGTVTVTVEVHNLGDTAVNNVEVDDSDTVGTYQLTADIVSGLTSGYWAQLDPNGIRTITYTVRVMANGVYTLEPATVTYSDEYGDYTKTSEKTVIASNFELGKYLGNLLEDQTFMINPFMLILLLALILPPAVTAIRILTKKKAVEPPPPPPPTEAPIQPQ
jgi:uncharacterized repeat protein (TIGR01451 family)